MRYRYQDLLWSEPVPNCLKDGLTLQRVILVWNFGSEIPIDFAIDIQPSINVSSVFLTSQHDVEHEEDHSREYRYTS